MSTSPTVHGDVERLLAHRHVTRRFATRSAIPCRALRGLERVRCRGWYAGSDLEGALEGGEEGVAAAALEQVAAEALVQERQRERVALRRRARWRCWVSSTACGAAPVRLASSAAQEQSWAWSSPASSCAIRARHSTVRAHARGGRGPLRGRRRRRAWRAASTDAASASVVRPAAAQCGASSAGAALHCGRARRRVERAAPRAHLGGSSSRPLPPGARGGSGSCRPA